MLQRFIAALDRRLGPNCSVSHLRQLFIQKRPSSETDSTGWNVPLGWALGSVFFSLFSSGFLLLFYYRPTDRDAYESIAHIVDHVHLGWLILQLHRWGSHFFIALFILYLFREFWLRRYRFPLDWSWVLSVLLFLLALTFCITGRLLPWDQHAFHATVIATEILRKGIWFFGEYLCFGIRGGNTVSGETLSRFFVFHTFILPASFLLVFVVRSVFVWAQGSVSFRHIFFRKTAVFLFTFGVLLTFCVFLPIALDDKADPGTVPDLLKPEWYFLALHQLTKYFPIWFCAWTGILVPIFILLLPSIDRLIGRSTNKRKGWMTVAAGCFFITLVLSVLGHLSGRERTYFGEKVTFSMNGIPRLVEEEKTVKIERITKTECEQCHEVEFSDYSGSQHHLGMTRCHDCHGGNPKAIDKGLAHLVKDQFQGQFEAHDLFCGKCHENVLNLFELGPHFDEFDPSIFDLMTCTTCHSYHKVTKTDETWFKTNCLRCHQGEPELSVGLRFYDLVKNHKTNLSEFNAKKEWLLKRGFAGEAETKQMKFIEDVLKTVGPISHALKTEDAREIDSQLSSLSENTLAEIETKQESYQWVKRALIPGWAFFVLWTFVVVLRRTGSVKKA